MPYKFALIDANARACKVGDYFDLRAAEIEAGLDPGNVDHGVIYRDRETGDGISIVVYQFSFFVPKEQQKYYAMGERLVAGNAVLYQFDGTGATQDFLVTPPPLYWFEDYHAVERAIRMGVIWRPQLAVNGRKIWEWPEPPPDDIAEAMRQSRH